MVTRKKPIGAEYMKFVDTWNASDHQGKLGLSVLFGITYDTAKHWVSEGDTTVISKPSALIAPEEDRPNTPTYLSTKLGLSKAIVLGDTHCPYQDNKAIRAVETLMAAIQPDYIIYNGDLNDFYQVSTFSKDPNRLGQMQADIDITTAMFRRHRDLVPEAAMMFVEGTHENRWYKYLRDKAPAVSQLRGTTISSLYELDKLDIEYVPFERGILVNNTFLILHGDFVSEHSSYTAKRQFEKNGGSGICNHTHRLGSYFKRDRFGEYGWWENGCLCRLDPDWIISPNWQQGFSVITFQNDGRFWVEQVPIIDGVFIYASKLYGKR